MDKDEPNICPGCAHYIKNDCELEFMKPALANAPGEFVTSCTHFEASASTAPAAPAPSPAIQE